MNSNHLKRITVLTFIALAASALAIRSHTANQNVVSPGSALPIPNNGKVPDEVVYDFLFRKVVRFREKTSSVQALTQIQQRKYFPIKAEAGLNEAQATTLEAVAFACQQEVARQDQKAMVIIKDFQALFPEGRVPKGGHPPLPPELKTLWEERKAMILRARDQLRGAFGEESFAKFDDYVKFHYGENKRPVRF
ncbi:MAG TPA: hypothetical protein VJT71_05865 [Pyrinomonadaceae bacterium]|nr:hypothetical protein [Pyrinomonadaceae bacterium]